MNQLLGSVARLVQDHWLAIVLLAIGFAIGIL